MTALDWRQQRRWPAKIIPGASLDIDFQASLLAPAAGISSFGGMLQAPRPGTGPTMTRGSRISRNGRTITQAFSYRGGAAEPEPELVVRRISRRLARIETLSGAPYSDPMPVDEAISRLREISR